MARRKRKYALGTLFIALVSVGFFIAGLILLWAANLKIPDFNTFEERRVAQSTKIYDRTGDVLLYDIHENIKRTVVPYDGVSHFIKNATVAIEDSAFYEHSGVRPVATFRAVFIQPLRGKGVQGGSTITQQVVKNTLLTSERKISRKLKEWVLAFKIEQIMSKEEILTQYLNEAPYGGSIYGVEEASQLFFNKPAKDVGLAEAAYLAALPQAPTYYSPYGNNREELEERKNLVLSRMRDLGFITEREYEDAKNTIVTFAPQQEVGIKAPHFVFYVRSYLEQKYGKDVVEQGGLRIMTTLDYELQKKAEEIVKKYALENTEKFNAENASLVAIDPKTGDILVMAGSRDYFDEEIDGNFNVAISHRQPGSAFKPFVYATAFKRGYTPDTVVFDLQTQFQTTCDPEGNPVVPGVSRDDCYTPVNYDGVFRGPMTLRDALAQSVNIPAIKTLYLAGLSESLKTAKDLGISSLTSIGQYGLTLVLGGGEVSPLDITSAYGVFANDGIRNEHTAVLRVEDTQGNVLEEHKPKSVRVLDENIARMISDVLSDNDARAPAFGQDSYLHFANQDVAAKTGTTNDYRDAWVVGYTPQIAVGAWAGNNDNSPMEKRVAGFIIAPLWREFMNTALATLPNDGFRSPQLTPGDIKPVLRGEWKGNKTYTIDTITGKLATEFTPEETKEKRVLTEVHNILHWVNKDNPRGPVPENPESDSQYYLWEHPVQKWVAQNNIQNQSTDIIPNEYDGVHKPEFVPIVSIQEPTSGVVYGMNAPITIRVGSQGRYPMGRADFYINGTFIGSSQKAPFLFSFVPRDIDSIETTNVLRVVGYDTVFNRGETTTAFTVH